MPGDVCGALGIPRTGSTTPDLSSAEDTLIANGQSHSLSEVCRNECTNSVTPAIETPQKVVETQGDALDFLAQHSQTTSPATRGGGPAILQAGNLSLLSEPLLG